eukprot:1682678-Pyramimonas_sp.AAC.1
MGNVGGVNRGMYMYVISTLPRQVGSGIGRRPSVAVVSGRCQRVVPGSYCGGCGGGRRREAPSGSGECTSSSAR